MFLSVAILLSVVKIFAYNNGAPNSRLPALGWSSWVALGPGAHHPVFDYCDESSVMHSIDAFMAVGLYDAGYRHFHLDDCWAGGRNETGFLYGEKDHWPNGLKPVIDHAHSKGLTFGLYTCGGTKTCVGGRPGSKDHWEQDANVWAEWGVDWVKMDWCNTKGMDPKKTYPLMSAALNKTGRHIHFNMCEWGKENPWEWGYDIAQSWRMSGDHTGIWSSTKNQIRQTMKIPAEYTGKAWGWNDMDMLQTGNYEQAAHANGKQSNMTATEYMTEFSMWAIAASPLTVTTPIMNCSGGTPVKSSKYQPADGCSIALTKQISQAKCIKDQSFGCFDNNKTMWTDNGCRGDFECDGMNIECNVMNAGRHFCECKPFSCEPWISELQKKILLNKEVIAINQDVTPQGMPIVQGDSRIWARNLTDGSIAVALYNEADHTIDVSVQFTQLGWKDGTTASVRDLWLHHDEGSFTGRYPAKGNVTVSPHETILLRLSPQ